MLTRGHNFSIFPCEPQQMISLFSFISSPPKMAIDLGQKEAEGKLIEKL